MRLARTVLGMLVLLTASCSDKPDADKAPPIKDTYMAAKIADRVYVIHGPIDLPNKTNRGFINNPGFIITDKGVVVIDPGSSVYVGEMVLKKIHRITQAPVIAVFNTHIHGDHWLGNGAIKNAFPKAVIYAHPNMKAAAEAGEGASFVELLNRMTEGAIKGTQPVPPDLAVNHGEILKLGDTQFRIYHNGKAHTDGDIMIEVVEQKVIFLGDNAYLGFVPPLIGDFKGNIAALDMAFESKAKYFVPGHGHSGGSEVAKPFQKYLKTIYESVKTLYDQGLSDFEMKPKVKEKLAAYKNWVGFNDELGRHVSRAYLQVEAEAF